MRTASISSAHPVYREQLTHPPTHLPLPGYWCDVCQCLLKDSMAYLDHINGKKHQRALGYSMRTERVGIDK